jgi:hypothetical protein
MKAKDIASGFLTTKSKNDFLIEAFEIPFEVNKNLIVI